MVDPATHRGGRMKRRVALIASKEAPLRAALARIMRRAGYAVELAEGAKRAREVTGKGMVDLAIVGPGAASRRSRQSGRRGQLSDCRR